jgi:rod shape determining protein RodA
LLILDPIKTFFKKGDIVLLFLCVLASSAGMVLIYSATRYSAKYSSCVFKQAAFIVLGIIVYFFMTFVDIELIIEKSWKYLVAASILIILLLVPFGVDDETGNKNWVYFPGIPMGIQPSEIVKILFILLLAYQIDKLRPKDINKPTSVIAIGATTLFFCGLIYVVSGDNGSVLVYLFIFASMAYIAGVKLRWFAGAALAAGGGGYLLFSHLPQYIQMRILVVFNHSLDPLGKGYQQLRSLLAIGSGQLTGMGYLHGTQTQSSLTSSLPARHTDFIFAVCGEEFGMVGCVVLLMLLLAIIARCAIVSRTSKNHLSAYIAMGYAGMLLTQIVLNVSMCLYVFPVVGLTLPFASYGGSSILTLFVSMGIVSGIKMRSLPSWLKDRSNI